MGSLPRPHSLPRRRQVLLPLPPPRLPPVPSAEISTEDAARSTHQPAAELPGAGRARNPSRGRELSGSARFPRGSAFRGCQDTSPARPRPLSAPGSGEEPRYPPPASKGGRRRPGPLRGPLRVAGLLFFFLKNCGFSQRQISLLEL